MHELGNFVDVRKTGVDLRFGEKDRVADDPGLGFGQHVGHFGVHIARPRPAPDIGDALLIDRDDGDLIAGIAAGCLHAPIIGHALEALQNGTAASEQEQQRDDKTGEPVRFPESLLQPCSPSFYTQWRLFIISEVYRIDITRDFFRKEDICGRTAAQRRDA